jgi:NAD(P)-dependent dehydrogenase (short-subunit alcohol dehydrogenase family)
MQTMTTTQPGIDESMRDKIAVVTGGSQGLGRAVAEVLAAAGATVIIGDLRHEDAGAIVEALTGQGHQAHSFLLDVADEGSIDGFFSRIRQEFGRLDILVNCAGIDVTKPVDELSIEEWDRVLDVNLRGPFMMAKKAVEMMYPARSGHIVNITSTAAKRAWPNASVYHASKWGLLGFSRGLFTEARQHNVKVTAVVPGGMQTGFIFDRFPDVDPENLQDPRNVARSILHVLTCPAESIIPEIMVLPLRETSWP